MKVLTNKLEMLMSIDNTAGIEMAVLQALLGDPGRQRLQQMARECLPSARHPDISVAESRSSLERLQDGALYRFIDAKGKSAVDALLSMLAKLEGGIAPGDTKIVDQYVREVLNHFSYFCREVVRDGEREKIIHGKVALEARIAKVQKNRKTCSLEDLRGITAYAWLVEDGSDSQKVIQEMGTEALKRFKGKAAVTLGKKMKKKEKADTSSRNDELDALFSGLG